MPGLLCDTQKLLDSKTPFVFVLWLEKIQYLADDVSVLSFWSMKARIFIYYDWVFLFLVDVNFIQAQSHDN